MRLLLLTPFVVALAFAPAQAQIAMWKLGGSGLQWDQSDSSRVFIDFQTFDGALAPTYFDRGENILSQLSAWSPFKFPTELSYEDGLLPRVWRAANGFYWFTAGVLTPSWVDGDSLSYSPPVARGINSEWYTFDVGVPVPASQVGFYTPPRGFRADGTPLRDDIFKAFEISIAEEFDPVLNQESGDNDYHRLEKLIADVPLNFDAHVQVDFPKQYVRFIRLQRKSSIDDRSFASGQANVQQGTIGEFELKGEGVPRRVFYISKIIDLGREVNFGRIFWAATPMRMVGGRPVATPEARASLDVAVRSGRDADPNVYHEYTDTGAERVVTRHRYEHELKQPDQTTGGQIQEGKPGLRASIQYDADNWTFWSFPITRPGTQTPLERGNHVQLRVTLHSDAFFDFVRLDSLWIETSVPLARRILGEVARVDEPHPARGVAEVSLGEQTHFSYDLRAEFDAASQAGFDALRVRTGSRPRFERLEMGEPLARVEAARVVEGEDELVVYLPQRVTRQANAPLRLVFATEIFVFANTFAGEAFDTQREALPQQVEGGDASSGVGTSSLRVLGASGRVDKVLEGLSFSTGVLTPNGDGVHDRLQVDYTLFRLPSAIPVEFRVYDLSGRLRAHLGAGLQGAGPQQLSWDGRDEAGRLLEPGLYLAEISLNSEVRTFRHLQPVGIAY